MKIQWTFATLLLCALHFIAINIPSVDTFLFRRKDVHHVVDDPFQVKKNVISRSNLFSWLNMKNKIKFKLWTRRNPKMTHEIKIGDLESLKSSNFDSRRLTKIIIHGFAHSANTIYLEDWIVSLRDAYLYLADVNVMIIDYTFFAFPAFYWTAGTNLATKQLLKMIKFLLENEQITLEGLHILGFSWGAHIAGSVGYHLKGKVGRITGLDPAQPTFKLVDNHRRLDKDDAKFVDIIHTNSGRTFTEGYLGLGIPLGHADFYPNSGRAQPGCPLQWTYTYDEIECDHARSVNLFAESIVSPVAFPSCRCNNWHEYVTGECGCEAEDQLFMGEHLDHSARGKFFLFTRDKKPFGTGSQMKISLPDIDQYDPDFNNTGYHDHLRPFHLKNEAYLPEFHENPTTTNNQAYGNNIITLNPVPYRDQFVSNNSQTSNEPLSELTPPSSSHSQVFWEPESSSDVIKAEPVREYYIGYDENNDKFISNNLKRDTLSMNMTSNSSKIIDKEERQIVDILIAKPKKEHVRFSVELLYKFLNGSSNSLYI